jgi:hypothetical protein
MRSPVLSPLMGSAGGGMHGDSAIALFKGGFKYQAQHWVNGQCSA